MSGGGGSGAVGVVGLGHIGAVLAKRLAAAGMRPVVQNRTRAKADAVAAELGCEAVDTPAAVSARCDVVFTAVSGAAAVTGVYRGPDGLLAAARPGQTFVEASTIEPTTVGALLADADRAGVGFLDVTVTGSPVEIDRGEGFVMAGGAEAAFAHARPYLDAVGSVHHIGPAGSSTAMKLSLNAILLAYLCAASEALDMAERSGIDRAVAYDVIARSPMSCSVFESRRAAFLDPASASVQASIATAQESMTYITQLARDVGATTPVAERVFDVFAAAGASGFEGHDSTAGIGEFLRSDAARAVDPWPATPGRAAAEAPSR